MGRETSSGSAIRVEDLAKRFGEIRAVDGVSFAVHRGEIYGLLGPNGAGKTTTLSMISGLLAPDAGAIAIDGVSVLTDPIAAKARLGVVPQETALYDELTAVENLRFWGGLYDLSGRDLDRAIDAVLERVGLTGRHKEPVRNFSGGMKRRLNLALGLVHSPRVALLDEPTVGIDPQARAKILEVVREVAASGTTILYTTHYLEEAEALCDRIAIMDHGKVLAEGTLDELTRMVGEQAVVTLTGRFDPDRVRERVGPIDGLDVLSAEDGRLVLAADGGGDAAARVLGAVFGSGLAVDGVSIRPPSLNGLFLKLTGRELRD
jgi:ABC-2 type transport system ATP-binding protein